VRPDYVIGASNLTALHAFNAQLTAKSTAGLPSTAFGRRLEDAYRGGVTVLGAADLQTILSQLPKDAPDKAALFRQSGFADMKYAVWEHKTVAGREISEGELSFNGPRQGIAAWLAPPRQMRSLDFISPQALLAIGVTLTSPARIYDDISQLATTSNPKNAAMNTQLQGAGLMLKNELLSFLTGEIAFELDSVASPAPVWRVVLGVTDQGHIQQNITALLEMSGMQPQQGIEDGVTYYSVRLAAPARPIEMAYGFADGYLIAGSSHEAVAEAVRMHRTGSFLAQSRTFLAALPPGHPSGVSAFFYEDPAALVSSAMKQATPDVRQSLVPLLQGKSPLVVSLYGDEEAIREATTTTAFDPTAGLIFGAVAIPNLLRARTAANESSAVATLRMVNTAQMTYSAMYRGFAPDLATLGSGSDSSGRVNGSHAGLIDPVVGNASCTATAWCVKSGYRFRMTAECRQPSCQEFLAIATPVSSSTGGRNFCSTSDGVIRFRPGLPLDSPPTVAECRGWVPLQ
jgi:hypothetical protein